MTRVERRNHKIDRDNASSLHVKKENIMNKCRLYQKVIKEKDEESLKLIRGRSLEKLPFLDQMKLADINILLDTLNYKLSYCTKYLELIYEYVTNNHLIFLTSKFNN